MLAANSVSLDPDAFPDGLTIWMGPNGARAARSRDSTGAWSFINLGDPRYPGFKGYKGSGFFIHQCRLSFDHERIALAQDLIRAGNLILAADGASLVVREGPFDHLTFVGLNGPPFTDSLHNRVRNAIVANSWQVATDDDQGRPLTLFGASLSSRS